MSNDTQSQMPEKSEQEQGYKPTIEAIELARKIYNAGKKYHSRADNLLDVISAATLIDQLVEQRLEAGQPEPLVMRIACAIISYENDAPHVEMPDFIPDEQEYYPK